MTHEEFEQSIFGAPPTDEEATPPTRRHRGHRKPTNRGRRWIVMLLSLGLVGGAGFAAWGTVGPMLKSIAGLGGSASDIDFEGPGSGAVTVIIKAGQTGDQIATTLRDLGVTKTRTAYLNAAKADPERAAKIQPGTYTLRKGMTGQGAFDIISDPANRNAKRTTIREGLWASEIYPLLSKATGVPVANYIAAARNPAALGLPAAAKGKVEGWLAPSTYEFPDKSTATDQLKMMVAQTVSELKANGVPQADWEHTMILASLVEAEAKLDVDRPKIARVFLNRIETQGPPTYGLLQSDAAVSYGAKRRSLFPSRSELENANNPYNTRIHPGWPPGPISNPGAASVKGAAKPAAGKWFFFVAVNPITGETKYAVTLSEHNRNVAELTAYCRANPKDCGQ